MLIKSSERLESFLASDGVTTVRDISDRFGVRKLIPIKLPGIRQKKLVTRGIDQVHRFVKLIQVGVGVSKLHQTIKLRSAQPLHDIFAGVVSNSGRPLPERSPVMQKGGGDIEQIDDSWCNSDHPVIKDSGRPCRPTSLRGTTDIGRAHV